MPFMVKPEHMRSEEIPFKRYDHIEQQKLYKCCPTCLKLVWVWNFFLKVKLSLLKVEVWLHNTTSTTDHRSPRDNNVQ